MNRSVAIALVCGLTACIGTSPEEQLRQDQGEARDGDEEHRPGQPCLVCHGEDYSPGGPVFVLAGTVYLHASDPDDAGLEGSAVVFLDDAGHEFTARTNSAGNFMVQVRDDVSAPAQGERGWLAIPWEPVFPVNVSVALGGTDKAMETLIWRDGSCAGCHRTEVGGADHVEKVWFEEEAP